MRKDWDEYFLTIAGVVADRATCPRKSVGCVIVSDRRICSTGYNGARSGVEHCEDVGCSVVANHCTRAIHAERNAIEQLLYYYSQYTIDNMVNVTLYCTLEPCNKCKVIIHNTLPQCKIIYEEKNENL